MNQLFIYKKLLLLSIVLSCSTIMSMDKNKDKSIINPLHDGSKSQLTRVLTQEHDVELQEIIPAKIKYELSIKPTNDRIFQLLGIRELILEYLVSDKMIRIEQRKCARAIKNLDYDIFKKSFEKLKTYSNIHSYGKTDLNYIEYYDVTKSFLHEACSIDPRYPDDDSDEDYQDINTQYTILDIALHSLRYPDNYNLKEKEAAKIAIIQEFIDSKVNLHAESKYNINVIQEMVLILNDNYDREAFWTMSTNEKYVINHYGLIIKMLVDAGVNINEKSSKGQNTALSLAVARNNFFAVKILLNLGAGKDEYFWIDLSEPLDGRFDRKLPKYIKTRNRSSNPDSQNMMRISLQPKEKKLSSCTIS